MIADHTEVVQRGLRLQKIGNELLRILGGRPVHPVNVTVGLFNLVPGFPLVTGALDLARLDAAPVGPADGKLLLIGRRHQRDCNSWMHNTTRLTRGKPRHHLLMHPADLDSRGLVDGAMVTVASRVGKVVVEVRATEDVMPGVVSLPHGYGHQHDGIRLGVATTVTGVSINDLTDPDRLDVSGNAALSGVPVTVF